MSITNFGEVFEASIILIIGMLVLVKSKYIAKGCRLQGVKIWGGAKYDDLSELVARGLMQLVGIVFILGSFSLFYRLFSS